MKRKVEVNSDIEVEKKEKKELVKGLGKFSKVEKVVKSKGKKVKEEEEEVNFVSFNEWEDNSQGEGDLVLSDCNKFQFVISLELVIVGVEYFESVICSRESKKDNGVNFVEFNFEELKFEEFVDFKFFVSRLLNLSVLYENILLIIFEYEMDVFQLQEYAQDLVKGDCNNSND